MQISFQASPPGLTCLPMALPSVREILELPLNLLTCFHRTALCIFEYDKKLFFPCLLPLPPKPDLPTSDLANVRQPEGTVVS